ncbi:hypothetical protein EXIGLDRAFT_759583 [Exidia glandulosa HHB12029]|uniref:Uncharacterized protein n=1 Tax=Exidia glandulosa HHB12029 TaxID=1314781 RepID=A0A165PZG4_EXIGL|nr:hypothetical protein EXIGLDRAFT_759583 [Exidia glandulosa HHB12029]
MDARSLLRAKREQAKIEHPYASYASGQLKCTICATPIKDGAAWDGHLGSKAHRKNIQRLKAEQEAATQAAQRPAKRQAQADSDEEETASKKRRVEEQPGARGFPANFFSDPSRALPADDDDEQDEEEAPATAPASAPAPASELDAEWEAFQKNVINADLAAESREESFARATVAAEPELLEELPQGFPAELAARRRAAQAQLDEPPPPAPVPEETEAEKKRRLEKEEKELIMDRILEEERLQEEADNKVTALKARLDLIKRQRAAKQKAK